MAEISTRKKISEEKQYQCPRSLTKWSSTTKLKRIGKGLVSLSSRGLSVITKLTRVKKSVSLGTYPRMMDSLCTRKTQSKTYRWTLKPTRKTGWLGACCQALMTPNSGRSGARKTTRGRLPWL